MIFRLIMDTKTQSEDMANYDDDYDYYRDFWLGHGREYENLSEQLIIRKLLPGPGRYALDIGGGFGRLLPLYARKFEACVVLDYSMKNLKRARTLAISEGMTNLLLVAADAAQMPFSDSFFDFAISVRLSHHFEDPESIISETSRVLANGGCFIFEFANKRNFKSVLMWIAGRQKDVPFSISPRLIGKNIRNFHPKYINRALHENGFGHIKRLSASNFRLGILKRALSPGFLAKADLVLSGILGLMYFGPSIFTRSSLRKDERPPQNGDECFLNNIFKCPVCSRSLAFDIEYPLDKEFNLLRVDVLPSSFKCGDCGFAISEHDGIFDFR